MKAVYLETSALLRWILGEPGAARVASLIGTVQEPLTSVLTILEARRAIVRARSEVAAGARTPRLDDLVTEASKRWTLAEVSAEIRSRAARPFPLEPVRTLDAIHLATALEFSKVFPDLLVFSFDQRILSNLEPLGLRPALLS